MYCATDCGVSHIKVPEFEKTVGYNNIKEEINKNSKKKTTKKKSNNKALGAKNKLERDEERKRVKIVEERHPNGGYYTQRV